MFVLCGKCKSFVPNGGVTSIGAVYNEPVRSDKLGNCKITGELKNELNSCSAESELKLGEDDIRDEDETE